MFPDFNIYSTPLFILVIQGLILAVLLFNRYRIKHNVSDLILGLLVLITCYHRTTYTIGFMAWYDTFRNTKINYYLITLAFAVGPLIYLYLKSCVKKEFKIDKKSLLHFVPVSIYVILRIFIFLYDSMQEGFEDTQNGVLQVWSFDYLNAIFSILFTFHLMLYLAFSFQLYYRFRKQLVQEHSNTYQYELRWLRNFLYLYTFLFLYECGEMITDGLIFDMHWTQEWWYQFFSTLVVIYVGLMGYFTPVENLKKLDFPFQKGNAPKPNSELVPDYKESLERLINLVKGEQLFLDPSLSLGQLAKKARLNPSQLSQMINAGLGKNFNDFINEFRVEEVKRRLTDANANHFSILAIALDAGFNSKATFNRVFKRISGQSPSDFRK